MNAAKIPFTMMELFGIWQPISWTSTWAIYFYRLYKVLIISAFTYFVLSLLIYISKFAEDLDSLTESLFVTSAFCSVGMKMLSILLNREKIISVDNLFLESVCIPRDSEEVSIQKAFEYSDRARSISFTVLGLIGVSICSLSPLLTSAIKPLPCDKIWIPYSLESKVLYWLTYIYQATVFTLLVILVTAVDVFIYTTMQRICSQLEIFQYRLNLLPKLLENRNEKVLASQREMKIFEDWIHYHVHIYKIGKKLNDIFSLMIFAQYFATTIALCIIIYHLAKETEFSSHFWFMIGSLSNHMLEIFFYCWYAEGMICKSVEIINTVYEINWDILSVSSQKCLLIIMMRARRPIELIGGSMVTMTIETLVKIVKVSYSVFSVLRSTTLN